MSMFSDPTLPIRHHAWVRSGALWVSAVVAIQVLIIAIAGHDFLWAQRYGIGKPFNKAALHDVAALFVAHELPYTEGAGERAGEAELPPRYRDLTVNGKCYVTQTDAGEWLIFFPSYVGRRRYIGGETYVAGYLYDSRGGDRSVGDPIQRWIVDVSEPGRPLNAMLQNVTPTNHLRLDRAVAPDWYAVETVAPNNAPPGPGSTVGVLW